LVASRGEELLAATLGRGGTLAGSLEVVAKGHALRMTADVDFSLGHRPPYSAAVPARNAARGLPGPHHITDVAVAMRTSPMRALPWASIAVPGGRRRRCCWNA